MQGKEIYLPAKIEDRKTWVNMHFEQGKIVVWRKVNCEAGGDGRIASGSIILARYGDGFHKARRSDESVFENPILEYVEHLDTRRDINKPL